MQECKVCGRTNPIEEANFCYYCGASLRENGIPAEVTKPAEEAVSEDAAAGTAKPDLTKEKRPFTTLHWLGMLALLLIPPYGWIVFFVIALISAFGANATEERRSFAKACLIFSIVVLLLAWYMIYSNPEMMEQYNKMVQDMQNAVNQK